ncbi:MAG: hypothetical protein ACREQ2_13540 [Candidatus Binatia bacterium]
MADKVFLTYHRTMKQTLLRSSSCCPSSSKYLLTLRRALFVVVLVAVLSLGFVSPGLVCAKTYHGQLVDAETGEPLEGAVVVVVWHTEPRIAMDPPEYFHDAKEALTDAQGKFRLEASPAINWNPFMAIKDPNIVIFKPGYEPFALLRTLTRQGFKSFEDVDQALRKGTTIKLPKLKTTEQTRKFADASAMGIGDLSVEKVPNLTRLLNIQRKMAGFTSFY